MPLVFNRFGRFTFWWEREGRRLSYPAHLFPRIAREAYQYHQIKKNLKLAIDYPAEEARAGVGSYSAKTNWMTKYQCREGNYPLDYDATLDYIGYRTDFRQPLDAVPMKVLKLKATQKWYWGNMKGWWNLPDSLGKLRKIWGDGYYGDIADHYPVMADFYF